MKGKLNENIAAIQTMIDSMSEEELFQPHMRRWADDATKTAVWEVYKFIHVNTVAPFGMFRTKIRKWKKGSAVNCKEVQQKRSRREHLRLRFIHSQGFSLTQHHIAV